MIEKLSTNSGRSSYCRTIVRQIGTDAMLKLLQLCMVSHSKLSYLPTLLPSGTLVCSLTVPLSGGSAWNREQNDSKAASRMNQLVLTDDRWKISGGFGLWRSLYCRYSDARLTVASLILSRLNHCSLSSSLNLFIDSLTICSRVSMYCSRMSISD